MRYQNLPVLVIIIALAVGQLFGARDAVSTVAAGQTADGRPSPEKAAGASQQLTQLRQAIAALPGQDRLLVTLFLEGAAYREISEIIGISVNHVGVRLNRIRQALGKIVEET